MATFKSEFLLNKQPNFVTKYDIILLTNSQQCCGGSLSSEALLNSKVVMPMYAGFGTSKTTKVPR